MTFPCRNPLEPLLKKLSEDFTDDQDLSMRLRKLFKVACCIGHGLKEQKFTSWIRGQVLDTDKSGELSSHEFTAAMRKLVIICLFPPVTSPLPPLLFGHDWFVLTNLWNKSLLSHEDWWGYCKNISFVTLQNFVPWIHVTSTDFDALTRNRALCTERFEIWNRKNHFVYMKSLGIPFLWQKSTTSWKRILHISDLVML